MLQSKPSSPSTDDIDQENYHYCPQSLLFAHSNTKDCAALSSRRAVVVAIVADEEGAITLMSKPY